MSRAGCGGWLDILAGVWGSIVCLGSGGFFAFITFPSSSSRWALRSVEKGVFNSRKGLESRCREKRLRRDAAREGATVTKDEANEG